MEFMEIVNKLSDLSEKQTKEVLEVFEGADDELKETKTWNINDIEGMTEIANYMKQLGIFDKMHLDAFKEAYNNYYKVAQNY